MVSVSYYQCNSVPYGVSADAFLIGDDALLLPLAGPDRPSSSLGLLPLQRMLEAGPSEYIAAAGGREQWMQDGLSEPVKDGICCLSNVGAFSSYGP